VVSRGRRCRARRMDIFWRPSRLGHPRLGLVVPRHGGTAVARNRLRRRIWEVARRRILPRIGAIDLVLRPNATAYQAAFPDLATDLEEWLRSLTDSRNGHG
jgi:ribonuclease P protein component